MRLCETIYVKQTTTLTGHTQGRGLAGLAVRNARHIQWKAWPKASPAISSRTSDARIISLDRLGLEKVYVQAKRWKNTVGSPDIQGFMGALQLQSASKGVFITTSAFTRDAKEAAAKARGSDES